LIPDIGEIPGVQSVTAEYWTFVSIGPVRNIWIRAINTSSWFQTAYFEEQWISSVSSSQAFTALDTDNRTIILQKRIAANRDLHIGDSLNVWRNPNITLSLTVGGYFGPAEFTETDTISPRGDYSLVSVALLEDLDVIESSTCRILIRTSPGAQVEEIMREVESSPYVSTIESFQTQLAEYFRNPLLSAPGNILRIEVFFSFILASLGTSVIIGASLKEKEWELALMAARGSSKRQTRILLVGETTLWIIFAVIIGGFTGLVATYAQLNGLVTLDAFTPRNIFILFSPLVVVQFVGFVLLLTIFALIPVYQATRRAQKGTEVLRQG
jgi:ABC-type lipoprotein release transport system permease subunit